jgi:hypothetical protein
MHYKMILTLYELRFVSSDKRLRSQRRHYPVVTSTRSKLFPCILLAKAKGSALDAPSIEAK